jgi:hypothetical protein
LLFQNSTCAATARLLEDVDAWPSAAFETIAEDPKAVRQFKLSQQIAAMRG